MVVNEVCERGHVPPLDYSKHNELVSFPVIPSIPFPSPPCVHQQVFRISTEEDLDIEQKHIVERRHLEEIENKEITQTDKRVDI